MTEQLQLPQALIDLQAEATKRPDFLSQTSRQLHADLYTYLEHQRHEGSEVIEVGCNHGGSSIVLAYACKQLQMRFYTIDIRRENLDYTGELLKTSDLAAHCVFFHGTLSDFAATIRLQYRPLLVFIDGDHRYSAVIKDIRAVYQLNYRPFAVAFHDFSLRSQRIPEIAVDKAIYDALGDEIDIQRIGCQAPVEAALGDSWEPGGSEAALVELKSVARRRM
jgi:predicted O-methyltransferase YrrM